MVATNVPSVTNWVNSTPTDLGALQHPRRQSRKALDPIQHDAGHNSNNALYPIFPVQDTGQILGVFIAWRPARLGPLERPHE
jgi:hypothetical protein